MNKIFDTFDCQVHFFTSPSPGKFYAKIFWRVTEPDGEFFTKDTVQRFVQDPKNPAHFLNHDNEYLHYKDDWYIIDYDPQEFVLVYYKVIHAADTRKNIFILVRMHNTVPKNVAVSIFDFPYAGCRVLTMHGMAMAVRSYTLEVPP